MEISPDQVKLQRGRDRQFVACLVEEIAKHGGATDEALLNAARRTYHLGGVNANTEAMSARLLRKAKGKLQLATVQDALADFFEVTTGFTLADAAKMHVAHIRGTAPEAANYQALRDFEKLVLPQQPKQVQVDQRTLVAKMNFASGEQPGIDPLPIGGSK